MSNQLHGIVAIAAAPSKAGRYPVRAVPSAPARPAVAVPAASPSPVTRRSAVRDELDAVLAGATLTGRDRQFLSRLVHWDKRHATSVLSLLRRARMAGRAEAALSPVQLETVLAALEDAVIHRVASVEAVTCWDCEKTRGGRCADHARDFERARDYAELAALLSAEAPAQEPAGVEPGAARQLPAAPTPVTSVPVSAVIARPTDLAGYRRRAPIVS
jgi:hypothetical protein